ncbi:MAG: hypothetical protein NTZ05_01025, partial [Chloroflexi bacterium]|nr:hypothetical protein [Chloroflexota bacterium]
IYCRVGMTRHPLRFWPVLVGPTSKGRKGTSFDPPATLMRLAAPEWADQNIASGLSSGEGLIWAVRDPILSMEKVKGDGKNAAPTYHEVLSDPGISDKRLLVVETEFASVLKLCARDGNILSTVLRQAYDTGKLRTLVKTSPTRSTGAHISIISHVNIGELHKYLTTTDGASGFGNRFAWAMVRRSKALPEGGALTEDMLNQLAVSVQSALLDAADTGALERNQEARDLWAIEYPELSEGKPGMAGAMTARAETQVLRLSGIYA